MAIVTATVTVDFTANYSGDHRICWRIQGSGDPYDCTTIVSCVGGGTACSGIFNADVNTTSCDGTVTFEGYIQATCEDLLSTNGRLPFTVDFVPNVICQRHEILCARGGIGSFIISPAGQEYTVTDIVSVIRDGGDPETGDATVSIGTVGDGIINSISSLISGGLGYVATEVLTVVGSAGAGATITIDSVDGSGTILTYTLTTNGSGYIGPFTFTGGSGAGADFNIVDGVDYDTFGSILTLNIGAPGSYSIPPTISIASGTGSGANIIAELLPCPAYNNIGVDCDSNFVNLPMILEVGELWATCIDGAISGPPDEIDVTQIGCCIPEDTDSDPCTDFHIDNQTGLPQNVQVTACDGIDTLLVVADGTSVNICAILDGIVDPNIINLTITDTGSPCT